MATAKAIAKGTVVRPVLSSRLLEGNPLGDPTDRVTPVYLPPSYERKTKRRYPLLIAITGFTGTGRMLLNEEFLTESLDARLDRLIAKKVMREAIVVMPDCITRYGGSQYIDSSATGPYARYLIEEIIPWVDENFRTIPDRDARGIFGKSSGGYGSIRTAMDYPEVIGAFACHSGDMAFEHSYLREVPPALRYLWHNAVEPADFLQRFKQIQDRSAGYFELLDQCAMASCYSPNSENPLGFDLCFDITSGEIDQAVFDRWLEHDPITLIDKRLDALRSQRGIFIDCGTRDEFMLDIGARWAAKKFRDAGIEVTHEEFGAGHMSIQYRYDRSLPFLSKSLIPPEG